MTDIRKPTQKRSLEKLNRITDAGFELFCTKGYYETNTNEICHLAGVSTGALYSYFSNKKDIFIAAFQKFIQVEIEPFIASLGISQKAFDIDTFIGEAIIVFTNLYQHAGKGIAELSNMMSKDEDISNTFCSLSDQVISVLMEILIENDINVNLEKLYLVYAIIDAIAQENVIHAHNKINNNNLQLEGIKTIKCLLIN